MFYGDEYLPCETRCSLAFRLTLPKGSRVFRRGLSHGMSFQLYGWERMADLGPPLSILFSR